MHASPTDTVSPAVKAQTQGCCRTEAPAGPTACSRDRPRSCAPGCAAETPSASPQYTCTPTHLSRLPQGPTAAAAGFDSLRQTVCRVPPPPPPSLSLLLAFALALSVSLVLHRLQTLYTNPACLPALLPSLHNCVRVEAQSLLQIGASPNLLPAGLEVRRLQICSTLSTTSFPRLSNLSLCKVSSAIRDSPSLLSAGLKVQRSQASADLQHAEHNLLSQAVSLWQQPCMCTAASEARQTDNNLVHATALLPTLGGCQS